MSDLSTFLFARPSFLEGAARVIDLGNTLSDYNFSATEEEADAIAFACDWRQVAEDVWRAILTEKAAGVEGFKTPQ